MSPFKFLANPRITVEHIKDFYRYSEIAKWAGQRKYGYGGGKTPFGSNIDIDSTRENSKWRYKGIWLFGDKKWAYISIKNENVELRYKETDYMPSSEDCPITTNAKEISLITKNFLSWYKELKLPDSIEEMQKHLAGHKAVTVVKEIKINALGGAVLRILSDKTTFLLFNIFPPDGKKLTKYQADNFEKLLSEAIRKKVIHDDRELFIIFDDSQKMADDVTSFLKSF